MKRMNAAIKVLIPCISLLGGACASKATNAPDESKEDDLVGYQASYDQAETTEVQQIKDKYGARPELAKPKAAKKKCKGKGKKRTCAMTDKNPALNATHGVYKIMGDFRWGMSVPEVMALLADDIEQEYQKRQGKTTDAMAQDENRNWRKEEMAKLQKQKVQFDSRSNHRWGVTLIQYEYEDDSGEEMVWLKNPTMQKFFFFKHGELWKVLYAYGQQHFPGMDHKTVVDEKFKKMVWIES